MAIPAEPPPPEPVAPPDGADDTGPPGVPARRRRRPIRMAGAILALVTGVAVLSVGFWRATNGAGSAGTPIGSGDLAVGSASIPPAASASAGSAPPASSATAPTPGPSGPAPSSSAPPQPLATVRGPRLQATLDRVRAKLGIPGISATILFADGSSWTGVSGLADVAAGTPVAPDTAFAYASVSKTFTSALILQLIGEGKLRLTDSAVKLLPPIRLKVDPRITVGMLLDHTSGLADFFLNPKIDAPLQRQPSVAWTVDRTLRYVGKRLSPPGKSWHYSNTNYLLLGLIAERATGQPLATAIRERLLDPTGLDATWYQAVDKARAPLAHGYRIPGTKVTAKPVDLDDGSGVAPFRSVVTAAAGAGSIAGTSSDLAVWGRALYSGRVLGPIGTAMLLSSFSKTTQYVPDAVYGYGVQALSIDGHPSLGHSGRFLGFRSVVRHFSLDGLTIAVLTNQSRIDPGAVVRSLLKVAAPPEVPPVCTDCPLGG